MSTLEGKPSSEERAMQSLVSPKQRELLIKEFERVDAEHTREESIFADDRNFEVLIEDSHPGVSIKLKHHETGETLDLREFLPAKYMFHPSSAKFTAMPGLGLVRFKSSAITSRGFFLSLFHEIGHAHTDKVHKIPLLKELKAILQTKLKAPLTPLTEQIMPDWYLDLFEKKTAESERIAWAHALKTLREIEKRGFNVFAGFNNAREVSNYIAICLQTYDLSLFLEASQNVYDNRLEIGNARFAKSRPSAKDIVRRNPA